MILCLVNICISMAWMKVKKQKQKNKKNKTVYFTKNLFIFTNHGFAILTTPNSWLPKTKFMYFELIRVTGQSVETNCD